MRRAARILTELVIRKDQVPKADVCPRRQLSLFAGLVSDNVGLSEILEGKDFARALPVKQPIFTCGILV
jgi:hypothetical protein